MNCSNQFTKVYIQVSLVVPEYQLGTAYGMMQSIQNLGLALVSIAAGTIAEKVPRRIFSFLITKLIFILSGNYNFKMALSLTVILTNLLLNFSVYSN